MKDPLNAVSVVVIGGCGHVGLPLGIKLALAGAEVTLIDINDDTVRSVNAGQMPFVEEGGENQLREALDRGLNATTDRTPCATAAVCVFVTGTPIDEHLKPKLSALNDVLDQYIPHVGADALLVMRSTLFPGTMTYLRERIRRTRPDLRLAFCPERVAQGKALKEIASLPQIVSAFDDDAFQEAYELFAALAPSIIRLTPMEAELTKVMANAWRYIEFAIANQFYVIAESNGVDFQRVYQALRYEYPRAQGYKAPGFAGGPCLFKDTMQLASFDEQQFHLGHTAMLVNEGLASFAVKRLSEKMDHGLQGRTIGILGMTFKTGDDDTRNSLSFRVRKDLDFAGARVLCHDPFFRDGPSLDEVLTQAEGFVLCTPHKEYQGLDISKPIVDVWGVLHKSEIEILPGREE